jgi:putative ABC transport system ATP-binding protein
VILADEPTAALDRANAEALGADLVALAAEAGRTLITVTHDAGLAARMARRITLADGRIVEDSDG